MIFPVCRGKAGDQSKRYGNLIAKNSSANPLTSCRSRRGLPYHLSTVSSPSNRDPATQSTPLGDDSFPPGPERLVALKDLSGPSGPSTTSPAVGATGDGIETPYRPFNEHFSHHYEGDTGASQLDGDATDKRCSPLYGENQTFSWSSKDTGASDWSTMMLIRALRGPSWRRSGGRHLRARARGEEWALPHPTNQAHSYRPGYD